MNPDILSIHSENANVKSKIRLFLWYKFCIPLRGSEDYGDYAQLLYNLLVYFLHFGAL